MHRSPDQHLQLAHRNGVHLQVFFELKHHAPAESLRSLEPGVILVLVEGRVQKELRERRDISLVALHEVFLTCRLLLNHADAHLGFLDQTGTDGVGIAAEFGFEFRHRGAEFSLFELFVQKKLAHKAAEHFGTQLVVLLVFEVLTLVLVLHDGLDARIKFGISDLLVVHHAHRVAVRLVRHTVHGQKAHHDTRSENNDDPLGFFINPR